MKGAISPAIQGSFLLSDNRLLKPVKIDRHRIRSTVNYSSVRHISAKRYKTFVMQQN